MSKIDTISTAFAVVHTQKEIQKLEDKIFEVLEEVQKLEGPKGVKGDKGERGERGADGNDGAPGPTGEKGDTGERGEQGEQGLQGVAGIAGKDGERGERGEQGPQGLKGDKGDKGDQGPKGDTGATGSRGEKGDRGIDGAKGDVGAQGQRGPKGAKGDKGDVGAIGPKGPAGSTGPQGLKGDKGDTGLRGEKGEKGEPGTPAPNYEEKFETALEAFNKRLTENASTVEGNIQKQIDRINRSLSTLGGGGSYKIVDNADVDKSAIKSLVDDAVLIYDPTKKKFVAQSFLSILDRLKADLEVQYDKLVDEDPDNGFTYVGEAVPGTTKGQSIWRIKRIYEFGADGDLDILWANGTADFDKTWNNRATYTYSAD